MDHRQLIKRLAVVFIAFAFIEVVILIFAASNHIQMTSLLGDVMLFLPGTAFFLVYAVLLRSYIRKGNPGKHAKIILKIVSWGCFFIMVVFLFLLFTCIIGQVI